MSNFQQGISNEEVPRSQPFRIADPSLRAISIAVATLATSPTNHGNPDPTPGVGACKSRGYLRATPSVVSLGQNPRLTRIEGAAWPERLTFRHRLPTDSFT